MTSTAPMAIEMMPIKGIEVNPSFSVSTKHCFQKIRHFSGLVKTRLMSRKYSPISSKVFLIMPKDSK